MEWLSRAEQEREIARLQHFSQISCNTTHGGNLVHLYPFVLSAQKGLRERLGRMEAYHAKAKEIATLLAPFEEIEIVPDPPHTNMMHLFLRGERDKLEAAALDVAKETGIWLFYRLAPTLLSGLTLFELTVGEATWT